MSYALMVPRTEDQLRIEAALPGYMYALLLESLAKEGFEIRKDLADLANKSAAAALEGTLGEHQQKLCKVIEQDGYAVLKDAGQESVRVLIGGLSRCLVKIRDDGYHVNENGLLVALGIHAEIDDGVTDWGREPEIVATASKIENNLRAKGYFKRTAH